MKRESANEWYSAEYWSFSVADEADLYRLDVAGYSGDAGDVLMHHNGMNFTTYDIDNDQQSQSNCAADLGGGWWFSSCGCVCFTCLSDHSWCELPGEDKRLIVSRMMVKPQ